MHTLCADVSMKHKKHQFFQEAGLDYYTCQFYPVRPSVCILKCKELALDSSTS